MNVRIPFLCSLALASLLPFLARGDNEEKHYYVRVGDKAPEFTSTDDQGRPWKSTDTIGKKIVVLFFYEGDYMTDCIVQTREMQGILPQLNYEGAEIVGVSGDTPANHERFKRLNHLSYTLLADPKAELAFRLGVARSGGGVRRIKDEMGKEFEVRRGMTAARWTFIFNREGKVVYKKMGVKPSGSAREVLAFVQQLNRRR
jgi:peroxiredoxin Q/BCP